MPFSTLRAILPLVLLPAAHLAAHELPDNRANIVLRDRNHLSVTLYLSYPEALHRALLPQRPFAAFLVIYSGMKAEDLQRELVRAQRRFQSATRVYLPEKEAPLVNWVWPDAKAVQSMLQQRVMQAMVDPNVHAHEPPVEIRADVTAAREIESVRIRFPEEWQKVLVVWFRPSQQWVEGSSLSPPMKF
jgi:hypothetical protein